MRASIDDDRGSLRGQAVLLDAAPRAGESSIAAAKQATSDRAWMILGVDAVMRATPEALRPGIGLRPGGERPDLEPLVERSYLALYGAIAALAREGLNVAADVGHHDARSRPLRLWPRCLARLDGLPVLVVGVRCPLEEIMRRREGSALHYARATAAEPVPAPVRRWQEAVHDPGLHDLGVDAARSSPQACAEAILAALHEAPTPTVSLRIAALRWVVRDSEHEPHPAPRPSACTPSPETAGGSAGAPPCWEASGPPSGRRRRRPGSAPRQEKRRPPRAPTRP